MKKSGQDIDEIWKSMQEDARPKPRLPPLGAAAGPAAAPPAPVQAPPAPAPKAAAAQPAAASSSNAMVAVNGGASRAFDYSNANSARQALQRDINSLGDEALGTRKRAAERLEAVIVGAEGEAAEATVRALTGDLFKPLLKRFADPGEKVRELAARSVARLCAVSRDAEALLPYVFPVLVERFGAHPPREPSEEVRLELVRLLRALLAACCAPAALARDEAAPDPAYDFRGGRAGAILAPYIEDLMAVLKAAAADNCPEILIETCGAMCDLVARIGGRLRFPKHGQAISVGFDTDKTTWSMDLVRWAAPALTNRLARVRLAAIQAVRELVPCGAAACLYDLVGWQDPNILKVRDFYEPAAYVNFFAALATDRSAPVRAAFYAALLHWLQALPERAEHEGRLLPYLLSALTDEAGEVRGAAFEHLEALGEQLEREKGHEKEVKEVLEYLGDSTEVEHPEPLPEPFPRRPRLGARLLVRKQHVGITKPLLAELSSWTSKPKVHAAALLAAMLPYVEGYIVRDCHELLPALCRAVADPEISAKVLACARLLGRYVEPEAYLRLLLPDALGEGPAGLLAGSDAHDARLRALKILGALLSGSTPRVLALHLPALLAACAHPEIATSRSPALRAAALDALAGIVRACSRGPGAEAAPLGPLDYELYTAALRLAAIWPLDAPLLDQAQAVLDAAHREGGAAGAHGRHGARLVEETLAAGRFSLQQLAVAAAVARAAPGGALPGLVGALLEGVGPEAPSELRAASLDLLLPLMRAGRVDPAAAPGGPGPALAALADAACAEALRAPALEALAALLLPPGGPRPGPSDLAGLGPCAPRFARLCAADPRAPLRRALVPLLAALAACPALADEMEGALAGMASDSNEGVAALAAGGLGGRLAGRAWGAASWPALKALLAVSDARASGAPVLAEAAQGALLVACAAHPEAQAEAAAHLAPPELEALDRALAARR